MNTVYPPAKLMNDICDWLKESGAHYSITIDDRRYPELYFFSEQDYLLYLLRWGNA